MLYFAYGSNMNYTQMRRRCPGATPVGVALIKGQKLVFRNVADIIPDKGQSVQGVIWKITDKCLKALDKYEGFPRLYGRKNYTAILVDEGRKVKVMAYFMQKGPKLSPPSRGYLHIIKEGYEQFDIDARKDLLKPNSNTKKGE